MGRASKKPPSFHRCDVHPVYILMMQHVRNLWCCALKKCAAPDPKLEDLDALAEGLTVDGAGRAGDVHMYARQHCGLRTFRP